MHKRDFKHQLRSIAAKSAAVVSGTLAAAGSAMAQTATLSSGFTSAVTEYKPELLIIGGGVLGIAALLFFLRSGKRASN